MPVMFLSFRDMNIRPIEKTIQIYRKAMDFRGCLLIDDIVEETGEFWKGRFEDLLVLRYEDCRPSIYTTNVPSEKWEVAFGEKIAARLEKNGLTLVFNKLKMWR